MNIYLATNSPYKVLQLGQFFEKAQLGGVCLKSAAMVGGMPEVEETEASYEGNAKLKAEALAKQCPVNAWVLSDDSGLEVEALGGTPGVHSARFGGPKADAKANNLLLLEKMAHVPQNKRKARFVSCLYLLNTVSQDTFIFKGFYEGHIAFHYPPEGDGKIGYMPIFIPDGESAALAFLPPDVLETRSHRAQAFRQLVQFIKKMKLAPA